jgi:uncharacterized membrane protein
MLSQFLQNIRPLLHPILVHFPIALLFVSVFLDWAGYWLRQPNLTRAGFYTLVLGALGAGLAALSGPDGVIGDATVESLFVTHQNFALITVSVAVALTAIRFLAADGIRGRWALLYLACTVVLLAAVSLTGYYGGELTYHQGVGVATAQVPGAASGAAAAHLPTKPLVALIGLLAVAGLAIWLTLGRVLVSAYYDVWWQAVRREFADRGGTLWTLRRGASTPQAEAFYAPPDYASPSRPPRPIAQPGMPSGLEPDGGSSVTRTGGIAPRSRR